MAFADTNIPEGYWESFSVEQDDIEFLYNCLLERETPLTSRELIQLLVDERIKREIKVLEEQRSAGGAAYLPKESYQLGQNLIFSGLGWKSGKVVQVRPGNNPDLGAFDVIQVAFADGETRQFAASLAEHPLNNPQPISDQLPGLNVEKVLAEHGENLQAILEDDLHTKPDFVRIAGKWFPRGLLVDINAGHLNLAEAVLDMSNGGPLPTKTLLEQVGLADDSNQNLVEFSMDLALQEDPRFDEVGPSGETMWYLNRLEPEEVRNIHPNLRYAEIESDRSILMDGMLALERQLEDELNPYSGKPPSQAEVTLPIIYPHWRAGALPLTMRIRQLFPTAYEAPRIRFILVDGENGRKFPGWVVRPFKYVYGLRQWYEEKGVIPGSLIHIKRGKAPGEVIVQVDSRRPAREWVRTVLVGSDGGVVFAMLKQNVQTAYDERMAIAVPDVDGMEKAWLATRKENLPFERLLISVVRELAKLNPQSHVHASELYAAVNTIRRCPPGPILTMLASRPWFVHVGDMHFRFDDSEL